MNELTVPQAAIAGGAVLLAVAGTAVLVWRRAHVAGTTLVAPWWWAVGALWTVAGVEVALLLLAGRNLGVWPAALRYGAAATLFCPFMAVLGAKRPQHVAWQFIVLSFWGILVLPAAEALLVQSGPTFEIHGARAWFLLGLILLGALNSLPTRFWPSALLAAVGQTIVFWPYLPISGLSLGSVTANGLASPGLSSLLALLCSVLALGLVASGFPFRRATLPPLDRVWLDFRDAFGALWALRVAERLNAAAALQHWEMIVAWGGFRPAGGDATPQKLTTEVTASVRQSIDNLLRRFVSAEWIDARLDKESEIP